MVVRQRYFDFKEFTYSVLEMQFLPRVEEHCEFIDEEVGAKTAPLVFPVDGVLT